jgi:dTDP-4-dehydrorhamnose 3,5-epimerase
LIFEQTSIAGAVLIHPEWLQDERGFFGRTWGGDVFGEHGLDPRLAQSSISFNHLRGTLRGLHYQAAPHEESKLVRCTSGAIYDVAVDLRPGSPTFCGWFGAELSDKNRLALFVPQGCAHGFLTLADATEILYGMSTRYAPEAAHGVRWDDPAFGIEWPGPVEVISERDRAYPDFVPEGRYQPT